MRGTIVLLLGTACSPCGTTLTGGGTASLVIDGGGALDLNVEMAGATRAQLREIARTIREAREEEVDTGDPTRDPLDLPFAAWHSLDSGRGTYDDTIRLRSRDLPAGWRVCDAEPEEIGLYLTESYGEDFVGVLTIDDAVLASGNAKRSSASASGLTGSWTVPLTSSRCDLPPGASVTLTWAFSERGPKVVVPRDCLYMHSPI